MRKNKSAGKSFFTAAVIPVVIVSLCTITCTKTKTENFNTALGKDDAPAFSQSAQTLLNEAEYETAEENIEPVIRHASPPPNKGIVEIKEKMFLAQVNDVYLNPEDYLGKTIKLEGIFKEEQGYEKSYCFVIRYGPGCCGLNGNAGFEVTWAKEKAQSYPPVDSWVEAAGVLKSYEADFMRYFYLDLASLNVLSKRGVETVLQ